MKNTSFRLFDFGWLTALFTIAVLLFASERDALGDINNDGDIGVPDIVRLINMVLEIDPPPTNYELWAADVNVDDAQNIIDIILLAENILEIDDCPEFQSICSDDFSECCSIITEHIYDYEVMDTLAEHSSLVCDVEYLAEDDIWAVGEFTFFEDGYSCYNVAHYNGTEWEYSQAVNCARTYSIHYVSEDDIWMTSRCKPRHWDGEVWTWYDLGDICVGRDIFWVSQNDIYFVGNDANHVGYVAHFDGEEFTDISPGINTGHRSISGTPDGEHIFVTGWANGGDHSSYVLQYHNDTWDTLYSYFGYWPVNDTTGAVMGCTVLADTLYLNRAGAFWKYNFITGESVIVPNEESGHNEHGYEHIIVNAPNDIFFLDGGFAILHFNGEDWYCDVSLNDYWGWDGIAGGNFDYHQNTLFIGGTIDYWICRAVVAIGRR